MRSERAGELLAAYDAQLREGSLLVPLAGQTVECDGPVVRVLGRKGKGFVLYRDLGGATGEALGELIARQVAVFAARGERIEWDFHGHDRPADLPDRLRAAGFVAEEADTGTVLVAEVATVAGEPRLPPGAALRDVNDQHDLERIAALEAAVWGDEFGWLPDFLAFEQEAHPDALTITVAEAGDTVVCASWIRFHAGTEFASLWGGATLGEWRRRGIYRATVAHRANLAAARGFRYLATNATEDSRPILERLGFVPVTTTTPYVWTPRDPES